MKAPGWSIEGDRVRIGRHLSLAFHRTLRVPEDDQEYPLPPGLGRLPVSLVREWSHQVPSGWSRDGAVFIPLYQREALWLGFDGAWWRPNALTIACGGINVITGRPWTGTLHQDPQDYLVVPDQPWLDGFHLSPESVRQFVAAPLGLSQTVAEQLGSLDPASLRVRVFEPVPGRFSKTAPPEPDRVIEGAPMAGFEMGFAAGGRVTQRIYQDSYGLNSWSRESFTDLIVYVVNSERFEQLTGRPPPPSPISAETYTEHGLPWFSLYDEQQTPVAAGKWLERVKTLSALDPDAGIGPLSIEPGQIASVTRNRSGSAPSDPAGA